MPAFNSNFFDDPTIDNPFADPDVQLVANNINDQLINNEYDPFDKTLENRTLDGFQYIDKPAVIQTFQEVPKLYSQTQNGQPKAVLNIEELHRMQEELEKKEEDLARREEAIRNTSTNVRKNNWPPLPNICCFQPCFYQDIEVEIPVEFQKIVQNLYYLWIFHVVIMLANILVGLAVLDFDVIALGTFYLLLFTPFSYICWFRPAYKAFRSDSSFNFMVFFFTFSFQFVVTTIQAVGIPGSGTIGMVTAMKLFGSSAETIIFGITGLIVAIAFAGAAAGDLYFITKIHRLYRSSNASVAKAQEEFTMEFLKNKDVRNAASDAAAAAVKSQLSRNIT